MVQRETLPLYSWGSKIATRKKNSLEKTTKAELPCLRSRYMGTTDHIVEWWKAGFNEQGAVSSEDNITSFTGMV